MPSCAWPDGTRPRRAAEAPLLTRVQHLRHRHEPGPAHGGHGQVGQLAVPDERGGHQYDRRDNHAGAPRDRLARHLAARLSPRSGPGQPGGDVGGDHGEFRVRPRRERLADPRIELVLGQAALHEGGLEHVDDLLAVGMRRPEQAAACSGRCRLASRLWSHRRLPTNANQEKPNPAARDGRQEPAPFPETRALELWPHG